MKRYFFLGSILLMSTAELVAQSTSKSSESILMWIFNNLLFILVGSLLVGTLITLYKLSISHLNYEKKTKLKALGLYTEDESDTETESTFQKWIDKAWGFVPTHEEATIELDHDYDGIKELDNRMPPWWLAMLYGTIVFAFGYMYVYHWSGSEWSSVKQWEEEVAAGAEAKSAFLAKMANLVNEQNVELLTDEADLAIGKKTFLSLCIACHGSNGEGNSIGPNLTDEYWLHGGSVKDVFKTITHGVPEKGMIAWKNQLEPGMIQKVSSYILSLQGSNPPNAKEKQGQLWSPEAELPQ